MVAAVKSMLYVGETPWHGLGVKIDDGKKLSVEEALKASGLDREVGLYEMAAKLPNPAFDGENGQPEFFYKSVPERYTYDKKDGTLFGCVGPNYTPLQNVQAFKWFQPWLDAGLAEFHTAGALFDGAKVWVLAKLTLDNIDIAKNDPVTPYILLSNSHDGTTAVRAGFTPIRVVCWNTLSAAHAAKASKLIRVRHTSQVVTNLETLRDTMNVLRQDFEATAEQYKLLSRKQFNQKDVMNYVKKLVGVAEDKADDDIPTRTANIMGGIFERIFNGKGQDNPAVKNTWWAAYNGYNEYLNYAQGRNQSNRLNNLWFGQNAAANDYALKLALTMAA